MAFALDQVETPVADLMTVSEANRAKESMETKKEGSLISQKSCLESQETVKNQHGPINLDDIQEPASIPETVKTQKAKTDGLLKDLDDGDEV